MSLFTFHYGRDSCTIAPEWTCTEWTYVLSPIGRDEDAPRRVVGQPAQAGRLLHPAGAGRPRQPRLRGHAGCPRTVTGTRAAAHGVVLPASVEADRRGHRRGGAAPAGGRRPAPRRATIASPRAASRRSPPRNAGSPTWSPPSTPATRLAQGTRVSETIRGQPRARARVAAAASTRVVPRSLRGGHASTLSQGLRPRPVGRGRLARARFWIAVRSPTCLRFAVAEHLRPRTPVRCRAVREGVLMSSSSRPTCATPGAHCGPRPSSRSSPCCRSRSASGANTALFSILNSLVLKSLPVHEPERLASRSRAARGPIRSGNRYAIAPAPVVRRRVRLEQHALRPVDARRNRLRGRRVRQRRVLRRPRRQRRSSAARLTIADDVRGGGPDGPVAVIGYDFWQKRFGGTDDAIGRRSRCSAMPFTIVGVLPPGSSDRKSGARWTSRSSSASSHRRPPRRLRQHARPAIDVVARRSWRASTGQTIEQATRALRGFSPIRAGRDRTAGLVKGSSSSFLKDAFTLMPARRPVSRICAQRYSGR